MGVEWRNIEDRDEVLRSRACAHLPIPALLAHRLRNLSTNYCYNKGVKGFARKGYLK